MRSSVHVVAPCCILSHRLRGRQTLVSLETPRLEEYKAKQGSQWRQRALTAVSWLPPGLGWPPAVLLREARQVAFGPPDSTA